MSQQITTEFNGFPQEALTFFDRIRENNNKQWFEENKPLFKEKVQAPAQEFVVALGERLATIAPSIRYDTKLTGSGSIMRIYRDVRFSKDKSPYTTNMGIVWWEGEGKKMLNPSFYFHMAHDDTWLGGGLYHFPDLDQYRRAVDDDVLGNRLVEVSEQMASVGHSLNGDMYKRVPRGYDPDHPRAELLKMKGMTCGFSKISDDVVMSPSLVDVCFDYCQQLLPMHQWLVAMQNMPVD